MPSVSLQNVTATQGSSFYIRCNVSGYPEPQITWKKDGEVVKLPFTIDGKDKCESRVTNIYVLSTAGETSRAKTLVICNADYKKHSGQFSCTARNKFGNDTARAFININGKYCIVACSFIVVCVFNMPGECNLAHYISH